MLNQSVTSVCCYGLCYLSPLLLPSISPPPLTPSISFFLFFYLVFSPLMLRKGIVRMAREFQRAMCCFVGSDHPLHGVHAHGNSNFIYTPSSTPLGKENRKTQRMRERKTEWKGSSSWWTNFLQLVKCKPIIHYTKAICHDSHHDHTPTLPNFL